MASLLSFDELNVLHKKDKQRSMSYERYFGDMELPKESKKDRIAFAKKADDIILLALSSIYVILDHDLLANVQNVKNTLEHDLLSLVNEYTYPDVSIEEYIREYANRFVDTTLNHVMQGESGTPEDIAYWLSEDRARYNAENETNVFFNYEDFRQAVIEGKEYKQWITMKDERVRATHAAVDDVIVPIDGYFKVGECFMRFPKDWENGTPDEIINCRCTLRYL